MKSLDELVEMFYLNRDQIQVDVGEPNGWGWADVLLAQCIDSGVSKLHGRNPYEYTAYDSIADEWPETCTAVENGEPGADARLRELMDQFRAALPQTEEYSDEQYDQENQD